MKPRPLYLSLTFWSGLLTLLFIGWAWWDSEENWSGAMFGRFYLEHHASALKVGYDDTASRWDIYREKHEDSGSDLVPYIGSISEGVWEASIPHWIVLLAVALPWAGLLFWRAGQAKPNS